MNNLSCWKMNILEIEGYMGLHTMRSIILLYENLIFLFQNKYRFFLLMQLSFTGVVVSRILIPVLGVDF